MGSAGARGYQRVEDPPKIDSPPFLVEGARSIDGPYCKQSDPGTQLPLELAAYKAFYGCDRWPGRCGEKYAGKNDGGASARLVSLFWESGQFFADDKAHP